MNNGITLIGMAGRTAAEVASDLAMIVDAEQLVEGGIGQVIDRSERIRRAGRANWICQCNSGKHHNAHSGHNGSHHEAAEK